MTTLKTVEEILPTENDLVKVGEHYWGGDYEPTYLELTRLKVSFADILTPKIEKALTQHNQATADVLCALLEGLKYIIIPQDKHPIYGGKPKTASDYVLIEQAYNEHHRTHFANNNAIEKAQDIIRATLSNKDL